MTYSKILNIDRHYPSMEENKETATYRGKECCLREARVSLGYMDQSMKKSVAISSSLRLFKIIYFNWRIITLQYWDGFCRISVWINHRYTCVSSWTPLLHSSPPHTSRLSQSTGCGCPASCIKLASIICFTYGNVYVSVLFSQVIPPSSLRVGKSVL